MDRLKGTAETLSKRFFRSHGCLLTDRVAELDKGLIGVDKPDETLAGELDLESGIHGERDRQRQRDAIKPASRRCRHAIASNKGASPTQDKQEQEDDTGGVHVECVLTGGSDVDHVIQRRQK